MNITATCANETCPNAGIEVVLELPEDFSTDVICACENLCTIKEN